MTNLTQQLKEIENAQSPEAIFGHDINLTLAQLKVQYRKLAAVIHPDANRDRVDVATAAFQQLTRWYNEAKRKVNAGNYGRAAFLSIKTKSDRYISYDRKENRIEGEICRLYLAEAEKHNGPVLIKLARHFQDNDLLENERKYLRQIERSLALDPLRPHFPTLIETVFVKGRDQVERVANLLVFEEGTVSLADVIAAYPSGIHPADMAWMFNRLLAALGKTHDLGLVHGAVLPEHFLIRPSDHNGILIDWCYSVEQGGSIQAISQANRAFYPPESLAKRPLFSSSDLYMAAVTMIQLLGGNVYTKRLPQHIPPPIRALLQSCLIEAPHRRQQNAWELFDAFKDVLATVYGPPTFRAFLM